MNVELGLKKIESLELDKKNLLVKLFDANELLNNVKTENMLLLMPPLQLNRLMIPLKRDDPNKTPTPMELRSIIDPNET